MEVVIPQSRSGMDFDFNSSPYVSAPSTPKRFGDYYFSAPTSPSHLAEFYRDFDDYSNIDDDETDVNGSIPFSWEEKPGTPRSKKSIIKDDGEFAFAFESEKSTLLSSADELFDNGKIKSILKLPPRLLHHEEFRSTVSSPTSLRSPKWSGIRDALKNKKKGITDPNPIVERGRSRSNAGQRSARSLSPLRVSQFAIEQEKNKQSITRAAAAMPPPSPVSSSNMKSSSSKKWRLKDLFLFRSSSEGRSVYKHPQKRFTQDDVVKTESNHGSKRRGGVSAHELHYTINKSVTQELNKKTSLPYKQGFFGSWFAFNPTIGRPST